MGSSVRHLVPLTGAIELCTCRCITHVSNRNIPKSIFHSLREVQALINFVVDGSDFRFSIQEDIGWCLRAEDVCTGHAHIITIDRCKQIGRMILAAPTLIEKHAMIGLARAHFFGSCLTDHATCESWHEGIIWVAVQARAVLTLNSERIGAHVEPAWPALLR